MPAEERRECRPRCRPSRTDFGPPCSKRRAFPVLKRMGHSRRRPHQLIVPPSKGQGQMAPAVNRNAAEIDYVNQPDPSTNRRPELETGANHAEPGTKLLRVVAVGFGVLCILQVALNVSLRLALNKPQPTPDEVFCGNETREACELKQQTSKCEDYEMTHRKGPQMAPGPHFGHPYLSLFQYEGNVKLIRRFNTSTGQYLQKGWLYFRDSFYYMSSIKKTWPESQEYCQQEDADLVIVNSREEQNFITQFSRNRFTWTGLRELAGTDQWIWVDEALLTESYWGPNEPNRLEKENPICVEMRFFDTENSWNDISCTTENFWMCEKEAPL
ncbi:hypothetical protein CCH79_00014184 [Gambusia affinis]|uniref:C-type lectin domain-containing protein n=1 Tax=Gambusia affinis TaxID=33528 RepID=A0A315V7L8_GAMAF|nr:hypothetical protein CCH79_00014184 [Gambusia affinis]